MVSIRGMWAWVLDNFRFIEHILCASLDLGYFTYSSE